MSIVGWVLDAFHNRKWLIELVLAGLVVGLSVVLVNNWKRDIFENGMQAQQAIDKAAFDKYRIEAEAKTKHLQEVADEAHRVYESEKFDNLRYRAEHPLGVSQLCKRPSPGGPAGSQTADEGSRASPASPPATVGTGVPSTDNGQAYDRTALLSAFAALFDDEEARLREYIRRE